MTSPLFAIVGSGVLTRHRWEAEGGAAATVFLDAAAPLHAAFVFIYCLSVVLVVWGRTVFPAHTTYLLFALFHATLLMLAAPLGTAEFVFLPVNCPRAGGSRAACLDSFFWPSARKFSCTCAPTLTQPTQSTWAPVASCGSRHFSLWRRLWCATRFESRRARASPHAAPLSTGWNCGTACATCLPCCTGACGRPGACAHRVGSTLFGPFVFFPFPLSRLFPRVHQSGELTLWFALRHAFGTALLSLVVTPFALTLLYEPPLSSVGVAELDTCPKPLRPLRAAVVRAAMGARRHAFGGQPILDASSHAFILVYATSLLCFHLAAAPFTTSFLYIGNRFCGVTARAAPSPDSHTSPPTRFCTDTHVSHAPRVRPQFMVSVACALARARESTATKIVADAAALAAEADAAAVEALRSAAVAAQSEAAILRGVAAALTALLPGAVAVGVASFHASGGVDALGSLFVSASSGAAERALSSALPDAVGALPPPPSRASPSDPLPPPPLCSSVHALCSLAVAAEAAGGAAAAPRLDSADAPLGLQAFSDWAAAAACGGDALPTQRALTLRIDAGSVCVGFATVHFPTPARASRDTSASVRSALDIAGRALFVRRAFSVVEGAGARGVSSSDGGAPSAAAAAHADASPPPPPAPAAAAAPGAMPRQISGGRRAGSVGALCAGGSTQRILAASSGAPLLERAPSGNGGNGGGGAAGAAGGSASERAATAAADFSALDACAEADAVWLRSPECDAWALPDEELVRLSTSMAHSLGLLRRFRLAPATWRRFVAACAARYSDEVPFHNWRRVVGKRASMRRTNHSRVSHRMPSRAHLPPQARVDGGALCVALPGRRRGAARDVRGARRNRPARPRARRPHPRRRAPGASCVSRL